MLLRSPRASLHVGLMTKNILRLLIVLAASAIASPASQLLASGGMLDTTTGTFYDVVTLGPVTPGGQVASNYQQFAINLTDPGTSALVGGFTYASSATLGTLHAFVSGNVSGFEHLPYSDAVWLRLLFRYSDVQYEFGLERHGPPLRHSGWIGYGNRFAREFRVVVSHNRGRPGRNWISGLPRPEYD